MFWTFAVVKQSLNVNVTTREFGHRPGANPIKEILS